MPGFLRSSIDHCQDTNGRMSEDCAYRLTHPEVMTETELRDILRNSCIDFSNFEKLCRSELIEMYKRVAMPLPQRQSQDTRSPDTESNENGKNSTSSTDNTNTLKRSLSDSAKESQPSNLRSKSPTNESDTAPKKSRLSTAKSETECNGVDKRINDGMNDDSPTKKRQKITWP